MSTRCKCDGNLRRVVDLAGELILLADDGDAQRDDVGCGIVFGTVRDYAYKLRSMAQSEIEQHQKTGKLAIANGHPVEE